MSHISDSTASLVTESSAHSCCCDKRHVTVGFHVSLPHTSLFMLSMPISVFRRCSSKLMSVAGHRCVHTPGLEQVNTGNRLCSQISRSFITSLVSFKFAIFKSLDLYQPISSVFQSAASRWDEFIPLVIPEPSSVQTSSSVQARFPMSFMVIGDY